MMIKVNNEYLDFDQEIEIERQVKLFSEIVGVQGDFSYQFEVLNTARNRDILGVKSFNSIPTFQLKKTCNLEEDGIEIYSGFLRVERVTSKIIFCSFYSGNNDWFNILSFNCSQLYTLFDKVILDSSNIIASWANSSGIVWPLVNRGALTTRDTVSLFMGDFQPFIYVKDIFKQITINTSIRIEGDILKDPIFNAMITSNNDLSKYQPLIDRKAVYIGKSVTQTIPVLSTTKIVFDVETGEYYDSPDGNFDEVNSQYVSDQDILTMEIEYYLRGVRDITGGIGQDRIFVNGVDITDSQNVVNLSYIRTPDTITRKALLRGVIATGGIIDVRFTVNGAVFMNPGSYLKIKPVKFFDIYHQFLMPSTSVAQFVSQIFAITGMMAQYDGKSKVITTKKFNDLKNRAVTDLSPYVDSFEEANLVDFISDYGKTNVFSYASGSNDETEEYEEENGTGYGTGEIEIQNDFLEGSQDLLSVDFVSSVHVPVFGTTLPLLDTASLQEDGVDYVQVTSVTDNGDGYARFNFTGPSGLPTNGLVRVKDSTVAAYNGDWRVIINTTNWVVLDYVLFDTNAQATIVQLNIIDEANEDQVLLLNSPNRSASDAIGQDSFYFGGTQTTIAKAGFWFDNNFVPDQALYFDPVNQTGNMPLGLIDRNYSLARSILNDPVIGIFYLLLPAKVFISLDLLSPVYIKKEQIVGMFYISRITGYKNSWQVCRAELVKL